MRGRPPYCSTFLPAPRGALFVREAAADGEYDRLGLGGLEKAGRGGARILSCLRTRMSAALAGLRAFAHSDEL